MAEDLKHSLPAQSHTRSRVAIRVIAMTMLSSIGIVILTCFTNWGHQRSQLLTDQFSKQLNLYFNTPIEPVGPPLFPASNVISVETIELEQKAKDDVKRLGLIVKDPVKIVSKEKGTQIIHGRFLHITDIHPDPYYKKGSKTDMLCHSGKGDAGKYGDAIMGCDSPIALMESTIKWVQENLKDKIDFIVWTGDNVRHDNDRRYPRTEMNIFELNEQVSDLMYATFKNENDPDMKVDLIPSLGNNDVYPHNLFSPGPTLQTRELFKIWRNFIPQAQLHVFNRGAYFFQEVIPNQLAILSINTLYLFQSNPLVDNCDRKKEPGYKLFQWLGYVLKEMRSRNMKVWLSGHVPPNEKNYDISCLPKHMFFYGDFHGNRSPIADPRMKASIIGQSMDNSVNDLAIQYFGACEFIAQQTRQIVEEMEKSGHNISCVYMSGGQCRNGLLMRLLADCTGKPVVIPRYIDAAVVFGSALLGAVAAEESVTEHVNSKGRSRRNSILNSQKSQVSLGATSGGSHSPYTAPSATASTTNMSTLVYASNNAGSHPQFPVMTPMEEEQVDYFNQPTQEQLAQKEAKHANITSDDDSEDEQTLSFGSQHKVQQGLSQKLSKLGLKPLSTIKKTTSNTSNAGPTSPGDKLWKVMEKMTGPGKVIFPSADTHPDRVLLAAKYKIFLEQCYKQQEYRNIVDEVEQQNLAS